MQNRTERLGVSVCLLTLVVCVLVVPELELEFSKVPSFSGLVAGTASHTELLVTKNERALRPGGHKPAAAARRMTDRRRSHVPFSFYPGPKLEMHVWSNKVGTRIGT